MIFVFGRRLGGKVHESGATSVVTEFRHLWYLPVVPGASYLIVHDEGGAARSIPIPRHRVSVLAGYLRAWGAVLAGLFAVWFLIAANDGAVTEALLYAALAVVSAASAAWSFFRLGKLTPDERRQRETYAAFVRFPVDVALLENDGALKTWLLETVASRGRGLMSGTYRNALDPATQWAEIALDPTMQDRAFLEATFTLARIEEASTKGEARHAAAETHRRIWERLRTV